MSRFRRGAATAALTLLLLATLGIAPAHATNFGSTPCTGTPRTCVNLADNSLHTWYPQGTLGNDIPGMATAVQTAMNDYEKNTDIVTQKVQNATTDVTVTDYSYPPYPQFLGWVDCYPSSKTSGSDPNRRCDRQVLRFNAASPSKYWNTAAKRRSLSCHEIGHTLGLRHPSESQGGATSCLKTPFNPDKFSQVTSAHDNAHINAHY
ncbi:MAG TPA: hypothetical protein VK020_15960 [Microlunatus sp.]|nr:hypothetical protein [Microlunatus sp.]